MDKKLFIAIFIGVLFLGTLLRFYQLGNVPGSLEWDEVSYGYNAYSILTTGKDEYGSLYPMVFRAFGEYKQPVYLYLDVLAISVFGLSSFAVRFPSAIFGSVSIILVFLLTYELFKKFNFAKTLALLSMLSFAISPWSIQFSRGAFEANVSLAFIIASLWLFIKGLNDKKRLFLFLSTFLLVVSAYTYLSQKLIAPILFTALIIYGYPFFIKKKVLAVMLFAFFISLNLFWMFDTNSVARGKGVFFTANQTEILAPSIKQLQYDKQHNDYFGMVIHNRRVVYLQTLGKNYLSHFNPVWLFVEGDSVGRHHAPGMGALYIFSMAFIIAGVYFLLSRTLKTSWILFVLFLLAPIPASLTNEAPHSLRSLIFLPTWQIFEAAGVLFFIQKFNKKSIRPVITVLVVVLFLLNFLYYLHQYFIHTNTDFQKDWQYGYKEAIEYVDIYKNTDKRVVFSNTFEQPYIFYLFHAHVNPDEYINSGGSARTSKKCYAINNVYFGECLEKLRKNDIYVGTGKDGIPNAKSLMEFKYQNGDIATKVYEYQ